MLLLHHTIILQSIYRCNPNGVYDINIIVHTNNNLDESNIYINSFFNKLDIRINFEERSKTELRNKKILYKKDNTIVYKYYEILKRHRNKYNKNRIFIMDNIGNTYNNNITEKILFLPLDECTGIVRVNYTNDKTLLNNNMLEAVMKLLLRSDNIMGLDYVLNDKLCRYVNRCTSRDGMATGFFIEN
ncbi:hypothetical protein SLOPH_654 [Spraguea lophii 42_110]|uniref:Uncharacterized protein n=1 Tax=Spraguea lophii (strain 42_110) TaxID=1358809 RepID=S7XM04_SPRLO|nr:hypothetical protein SLOPH_654 [Spraguea lophii 42_110]